ncbi:hypothetical protein, partial [Mesorhizobium sp.]|uniref:hypothetical protein n=1 Tax=Mesorhizobium sp. TaxID=1871066 RepID=UPI0025BCE888
MTAASGMKSAVSTAIPRRLDRFMIAGFAGAAPDGGHFFLLPLLWEKVDRRVSAETDEGCSSGVR